MLYRSVSQRCTSPPPPSSDFCASCVVFDGARLLFRHAYFVHN